MFSEWLAVGALTFAGGVVAIGQGAGTPEPAAVYEHYHARGMGANMRTRLDTNTVIIFGHKNGTVLALHFTAISGTNVTYRWRSRAGASAPVQEGQSSISEAFQPPPPAPNQRVTIRLPSPDLRTFTAGGLRIVWSPIDQEHVGVHWCNSNVALSGGEASKFNDPLPTDLRPQPGAEPSSNGTGGGAIP